MSSDEEGEEGQRVAFDWLDAEEKLVGGGGCHLLNGHCYSWLVLERGGEGVVVAESIEVGYEVDGSCGRDGEVSVEEGAEVGLCGAVGGRSLPSGNDEEEGE